MELLFQESDLHNGLISMNQGFPEPLLQAWDILLFDTATSANATLVLQKAHL